MGQWYRRTSSYWEMGTSLASLPTRSLCDITEITIRSDLLSQIRGRVVVLKDRIHRELRHTIDLSSYIVKLGK